MCLPVICNCNTVLITTYIGEIEYALVIKSLWRAGCLQPVDHIYSIHGIVATTIAVFWHLVIAQLTVIWPLRVCSYIFKKQRHNSVPNSVSKPEAFHSVCSTVINFHAYNPMLAKTDFRFIKRNKKQKKA